VTAVLRRINVVGIAAMFSVLVLWELSVRTGLVTFEYIPPPTRVVAGLGEIISSGELTTNLVHTLTAAVVGWAIACVVGVLAGLALGLSRATWTYSMASVDALRALPIVAFVPVAVLLLGFTMEMEIVVAFYAALWPIVLNTVAGLRSVEVRLLEVGRVLRLGHRGVLWKLRLPAATPFIIVGMRLGLSVSLVLTLVSEMVGNPAGLGFALLQKAQSLQPEQMFAYIVVIGVAGIVLNAVLMALARLLFPGQMAASGESA
jgi:ABC-type nitrate/sulfonate/bicarbonate transport system permease component